VLHSFWMLVLDKCIRSALYSSCFTSSERGHGIHSRGSWVGAPLSRDREKRHKKHIRISQQLGHDSSHIQLFLQNEPTCYQNSSGMSSYLMLSNYVEQSPWEGIRSAARLYLMLFSKVCSDRLLQIAYWWSAFLQLKVDAKSTVVCGTPNIDPPLWLRGARILEDWW